MKIVSSLTLVATVGLICGCATTPDSQITSVPLNATTYNSGHIAQATLAPMGSETQLWLFIGGVPGGTALPAHVYTYLYSGSCANLGPKPAYDLNQIVSTQFYSSGPGMRLKKSVPVAYGTLRAGGYALVLRASPADGNRDIFCGSLG